ncbi:recombinase family protein [Photobacterium rosenbergii]|uniref:recombinase family protein n=1 Tax=Photobacterium rosenbergii TaxID=294936 RepID=UPI001C99B536|nr:recombinase family protein [Photobacterium rosenbergii]MBY5946244.1 recombinase family protein [Photobacterium rosenbergii]
MTKKSAVALVRVSTAIQEHGHGLSRQDSEISNFLSQHEEYELTRTISAIGESAYSGAVHDSANEFGNFLEGIEKHPTAAPDALLVASIDRLSRLPYFDAHKLIHRILAVIPELILCDTGAVYRDNGSNGLGSVVALALKISLANEESEQKSKRLRLAREKRKHQIANKEKIPNYLPFWLAWSGEEYVFNEHVKTVRKMVELRLHGLGSVAIQSYLNENLDSYPVPQRKSKQASGTRWTKSRIDDILFKEQTITGDYVIKTTYTPEEKRAAKREGKTLPQFNRELDFVCEGLFPAVIDKVKYFKLKKGRGKGQVANNHYNLLKGIAKCPCGSSFVLSHDSKHKDIENRLYLICNRRNQEGRVSTCKNKSTKLFPLSRAILSHILDKPLVASGEALTTTSRVDELEVELEIARKDKTKADRILKSCDDDEFDMRMSEYNAAKAAVKTLELELEIAIQEASKSVDSNTALENLKGMDLTSPEGRLAVNAQLRELVSTMLIDNIKPTVEIAFKDGTTMLFDPTQAGDIADTYSWEFESDREQIASLEFE